MTGFLTNVKNPVIGSKNGRFMGNRIWTDGEGMSWSTITEMLGNDNETLDKLKSLTLDLSDALFDKMKQYQEVEAAFLKAKNEVDFLNGNLGSCLQFAKKRLNRDVLIFIHDRKDMVVSVKAEDGRLVLKEEDLTCPA